jgi:hypothetical protein
MAYFTPVMLFQCLAELFANLGPKLLDVVSATIHRDRFDSGSQSGMG